MQEQALDKATAILELTRLAELLTAFPDDAFGKQVRDEWQARLMGAQNELKEANKLVDDVAAYKDLMSAKGKLEGLRAYVFDASEIELVTKLNLTYPKGLGDSDARIKALEERIAAQQSLAQQFAKARETDFATAQIILNDARKKQVLLDGTPLETWTEKLNRWIKVEDRLNSLKLKTQSAGGVAILAEIQNEIDEFSRTAPQDIPPSLSERIETLRKQLKSKWDAEFTQAEAKIKRELSLGNPDQAQKLLNDARDIANKSNSSEFVNHTNTLQIEISNAYRNQISTASFWLNQAAKILEPKPNPPPIASSGSRDPFSISGSFYGVNSPSIQTPLAAALKPDYGLAAKYLLLAEERLVDASNRGDKSVEPDLKRLVELRAKLPEERRPDNFEKLLQRSADTHVRAAETKWQTQDKDAALQELEQAARLWPAVEIQDNALRVAWEQSRSDRLASLEQFALAKQLYDKKELEQAILAMDRAIELRERGTTRHDETLDEWRKMRREWFAENQFQKASAASTRAQEFYQAGNLDQAIAEITSAIQARQDGLIEQRVDDIERQQDADVTEWNKQKETWTREQKTKQEQWQKDAQEWQSLIAVPANRERANEKLAAMEQNATRGLYLQSDQAKLTGMRAIQKSCGELERCASEWGNIKRDKQGKEILRRNIANTNKLLGNTPNNVSAKYWEEIAKNVQNVQDSFFQKPLWNDSDGTNLFMLLENLVLTLNKRATLPQ